MTSVAPVIVLFVASVAVSSTAAGGLTNFGALTKKIKMEAAAIGHPVASSAVKAISSQCAVVKEMFGFQYTQMKGGEDGPDMSKLTLKFLDRSTKLTIFKILTAAVDILKSSIFYLNETLTIFIHGFTDDPNKESFQTISNAFHKIKYFNMLAVDGSPFIRWLYLRSTTYVRFIGEKLGEMLAAMVKGGLDPKKIHMIGHSLGAHISGFAGKTFFEKTGKRIGRISGLDPAGPCFLNINETLRLQKTDADLVDVISSDAGVFGMTESVGHVHFHPNGGNKQTGCDVPGCSHNRAWMYYAASVIHPDIFPAVKCRDWEAFKKGECEREISYMGYRCCGTARGSFYLQTGATYPFGLGDNGTRFNNEEAMFDSMSAKARSLF